MPNIFSPGIYSTIVKIIANNSPFEMPSHWQKEKQEHCELLEAYQNITEDYPLAVLQI